VLGVSTGGAAAAAHERDHPCSSSLMLAQIEHVVQQDIAEQLNKSLEKMGNL
jgi:hypothetical protein